MFTFRVLVDDDVDSEIEYLQIALDIASSIKKRFPEKSVRIIKKGSDGKEIVIFDLD